MTTAGTDDPVRNPSPKGPKTRAAGQQQAQQQPQQPASGGGLQPGGQSGSGGGIGDPASLLRGLMRR